MSTHEPTTDERLRILIVDDLPENRFAFQQILKSEPYIVDLAASANEALALLLKHEYACVLCDVQMPDTDGLEMTRIIRNDPDAKDTPIIFITAHTYSQESIYQAFDLDAYDFVTKPIDPVILRGKLRVFSVLHQQKLKLRQIAEELAQEQASLRETNAALRRSIEELEEFAYVASHDLQEPLRMVSLYSEKLEKCYGDKLDERAHRYIHYAVDGAHRMHALIADLLRFSRVGHNDRAMVRIETTDVVNSVMEMLSVSIAEHQGVVTVKPLPAVLGDHMQLQQLFLNLIGNAIKFHGEEPPRVEIDATESENTLHFTVRDHGIGIAPEYFDKIFAIFQRLHVRSEYPGNGIGLAICKRIVIGHGGSIWVESSLGTGTTFHFTLLAP